MILSSSILFFVSSHLHLVMGDPLHTHTLASYLSVYFSVYCGVIVC